MAGLLAHMADAEAYAGGDEAVMPSREMVRALLDAGRSWGCGHKNGGRCQECHERRMGELRHAIEGLLAIRSDSNGVAGYHRNGDVATWDEFPEVKAAEAILEMPGGEFAEAAICLAEAVDAYELAEAQGGLTKEQDADQERARAAKDKALADFRRFCR